MNQITTRRIHINEERENFINQTLKGLDKYNLNIQNIHIIVSKTHIGVSVEYIVNIPNHTNFVFKSEDTDIYVAVTDAYQSAEKTLRRYHDKKVSLKRRVVNPIKLYTEEVYENEEELEVFI